MEHIQTKNIVPYNEIVWDNKQISRLDRLSLDSIGMTTIKD